MRNISFFLISREIFESPIWRENPHILKLFIWLIGNARYMKEPKKYPGFEIKRGEIVTSLQQIADENEYMENGLLKKWHRMKVSRMLKTLEEDGYIRKLCDTYGTHISICNYEIYQDGRRYKSESSNTPPLQGCDESDKRELTNNNVNDVKNDKNDKKKYVETSIDFQLSKSLLVLIKKRKPDFKEPNLQEWSRYIDYMIRRDNRKPEKIKEVINWCQKDDFWQNNILSTKKLRKQFDQLELRMKAEPKKFSAEDL